MQNVISWWVGDGGREKEGGVVEVDKSLLGSWKLEERGLCHLNNSTCTPRQENIA